MHIQRYESLWFFKIWTAMNEPTPLIATIVKDHHIGTYSNMKIDPYLSEWDYSAY